MQCQFVHNVNLKFQKSLSIGQRYGIYFEKEEVTKLNMIIYWTSICLGHLSHPCNLLAIVIYCLRILHFEHILQTKRWIFAWLYKVKYLKKSIFDLYIFLFWLKWLQQKTVCMLWTCYIKLGTLLIWLL